MQRKKETRVVNGAKQFRYEGTTTWGVEDKK